MQYPVDTVARVSSSKREKKGNPAIAARVREARIAAGLNQEEAGQRMGVTGKAVSRWENAVDALSTSRLTQIAGAFQTDIEYLLRGAEVYGLPDDVIAAAFARYQRLDPQRQKRVARAFTDLVRLYGGADTEAVAE